MTSTPNPSDTTSTDRNLGPWLANALERSIPGTMWHGPALGALTEGLTPEQAAAHPIANAHSIWELVLHIAAWADIARERLSGDPGPVAMKKNFPPVTAVNDPAWRDALATLERSFAELARAVAALDDQVIEAPLANRRHTAWVMIQGVIEHATYHGGQIALMRRALGILPPAS